MSELVISNIDVTLDGVTPIKPTDGTVSLDALRVPYAAATIVLPLTTDTLLDALDPRDDHRVIINAGNIDEQRVFNLGLRSRAVDHKAKTVTLELASNEALAMDYATLVRDRTPLTYQASLRAVCDYVLGKVPGIRSNRLPNSSGRDGHNKPNYFPVGAGASLNSDLGLDVYAYTETAGQGRGSFGFRFGDLVVGTDLQPNTTYTFSANVYAAYGTQAPPRTVVLYADGAGLVSAMETNVPTPGDFVRGSVTFTTSAAGPVRLHFLNADTTKTGANLIAWRDAIVEVGTKQGGPWISGVLAPGVDDANLTAYWRVTNLVGNPSVRGIIGNWIPGGENAAIVRETGWGLRDPINDDAPEPRAIPGLPGVATATLTTWTGPSGIAQGGAYANTTIVVPYIPVKPFTTYTVSCYALAYPNAKSVALNAQVFGEDGAVLDAGRLIATKNLVASTWTRIEGQITTGANAGRLGPFLYAGAGVQWTAGETLRTSGWMVYEGDRSVPYFDGATLEDANYRYEASGAPHASASTREPKAPREPEMFDWLPGVTAWNFLQPLTTSVGLRLFCDEQRVWRLIDPKTYTVPGVVSLSPLNLVEGVDTIGRDDPEVFATGVVVRYTWRDTNDIPQVDYDTAGTPDKVVVIDYARPFPGAGAAGQILARRNGTGRTQGSTGLARWDATPGMTASISLPLAAEQQGKIDVVEWAVDDTGLMSLGTRGLIDIPPDSWLDWDPDQAWQDVADTVTWASLP